MTDPREERELEAYLSGDSPVSRRYAELPTAEPPPELDARVLAAAEAEVKVVPIGRPWQRWTAAVGVAATVVLAFTLVMQFVVRPFGEPDAQAPPTRVETIEEIIDERRARRDLQDRTLATMAKEEGLATAPPARPSLSEDKAMFRSERAPMESSAGPAGFEARVAAPAIPGDKDLSLAVALIREAQANGASGGRPEEIVVTAGHREAGERAGAHAPPPQPDELLAELLRLYDAGDTAGAAGRLAEFLATYPEHPVSLRLADTMD